MALLAWIYTRVHTRWPVSRKPGFAIDMQYSNLRVAWRDSMVCELDLHSIYQISEFSLLKSNASFIYIYIYMEIHHVMSFSFHAFLFTSCLIGWSSLIAVIPISSDKPQIFPNYPILRLKFDWGSSFYWNSWKTCSGKLKELQRTESLPRSFCKLRSLQALILSGCSKF
jgi:hypothetical protein